jgi:hypothetical protein
MSDFGGECSGGNRAALSIPTFGRFQFFLSLWMEFDSCHQSLKSFALTSSQGMVFTAPDSISRQRLSASTAQAASTSGSSGPSRLSISNPASVARSESGSSSASRNNCRSSVAMGKFYVKAVTFNNRGPVRPCVQLIDFFPAPLIAPPMPPMRPMIMISNP